MKQNIKIFIAFLLPLLFGIYSYFNLNKWDFFINQVNDIQNGYTAAHAELRINGNKIKTFLLPQSDLFDQTGTKQVHIIPLAGTEFSNLAIKSQSATLAVNNDEYRLKTSNDNNFVLASPVGMLIFFVNEKNTKTTASLIWQQTGRPNDIVRCAGKTFCNNIKVSSDNWSPITGPFLDTDQNASRRGLPRGRWGIAPKTTLKFQSAISTTAIVEIHLLSFTPDHAIKFNGPILEGKQARSNNASPSGMYPSAAKMKVQLQAGLNIIELNYSTWQNRGIRKAAYISAINIREDNHNAADQ